MSSICSPYECPSPIWNIQGRAGSMEPQVGISGKGSWAEGLIVSFAWVPFYMSCRQIRIFHIYGLSLQLHWATTPLFPDLHGSTAQSFTKKYIEEICLGTLISDFSEKEGKIIIINERGFSLLAANHKMLLGETQALILLNISNVVNQYICLFKK